MVNVNVQSSSVIVSGTSVAVTSTPSVSTTVSGGTTVLVDSVPVVNSVVPSQQIISVDSLPTVSNMLTGVRTLEDLLDVDLTGRIDQSLLVYDQSTGSFTTAQGHTVPSIADGGNF